jgi:hypothetical protein
MVLRSPDKAQWRRRLRQPQSHALLQRVSLNRNKGRVKLADLLSKKIKISVFYQNDLTIIIWQSQVLVTFYVNFGSEYMA